jgi:hypothetical protein
MVGGGRTIGGTGGTVEAGGTVGAGGTLGAVGTGGSVRGSRVVGSMVRVSGGLIARPRMSATLAKALRMGGPNASGANRGDSAFGVSKWSMSSAV